jgi:hypothetical protein
VKRLGGDNTNLFSYAVSLLRVLADNGKHDEARGLAREGVGWIRRHPEWPSAARRDFLGKVDSILKEMLDFSGSARAEGEVVRVLRSTIPVDTNALCDALGEYTWTLLTIGAFTNAEVAAREAIPLCERKDGPIGKFWVQSMLGRSLTEQKRFAEAEPLLLSAYEGAEANKSKIPDGWAGLFYGRTMENLAEFYRASGRTDEAAKWTARLAEFKKEEAAKKR